MTNDPMPPVADDEFPEFAEPPQQRPAHSADPEDDRDQPNDRADNQANERQDGVDAVIERLRRERADGRR